MNSSGASMTDAIPDALAVVPAIATQMTSAATTALAIESDRRTLTNPSC